METRPPLAHTFCRPLAEAVAEFLDLAACAAALLSPPDPPFEAGGYALEDAELESFLLRAATDGAALQRPAVWPLAPDCQGRQALVVPMAGGESLRGLLALVPGLGRSAADLEGPPLDLLLRIITLALTKRQEPPLEAVVRRLREQVDAQRAQLERSREIHGRLVQSVLERQGLDGIGAALAELVTSPVVIEDQYFNLLTASVPDRGAIVTGRLPEWTTPKTFLALAEVKRLLQRLSRERRAVVIPAYPEIGIRAPSIIAPVVLRNEVLAYVSIYKSAREFEHLDFMACEQAAMVVALELMRQRTASEVKNRLEGDFLDDLIRGRHGSPDEATQRAIFLGYDLSAPSHLLLVEPVHPPARPPGVALSLGQRLLEAVSEVVRSWSPDSLVTIRGGVIIVVVPTRPSGRGQDRPVGEVARRIQERCQGMLHGASVSIGIGTECHAPSDYAKAYVAARRCLDLLHQMGRQGRILAFANLGVERVLFNLKDPTTVHEFIASAIGPLLRYDAEHGAQLVPTLRAYIEHNMSLRHTAAACVIHISTLRYRLRRVQEIASVDLRSADVRLNLHLALRAHDILTSDQS